MVYETLVPLFALFADWDCEVEPEPEEPSVLESTP